MSKAIQISDEAYNNIDKAKELAIEKAKNEGKADLVDAFKGMGRGSFAGYLINECLTRLEKEKGEKGK